MLKFLKTKFINKIDYTIIPLFMYLKVKYCWSKKKGRSHGLSKPLVISLTSYPPRFDVLYLTLRCLLSQSVCADKVILWIAHEDEKYLTENIKELVGDILTIKYCENIKSYKKIIPTLEENSNANIVTADDDVYYWHTWLEELLEGYCETCNQVIAHRVREITFDWENKPLPYNEWSEWSEKKPILSSSFFPTGCGGVLYPPHIFNKEVCNATLFMELCPSADDVWLYWMVRLNEGITKKANSSSKVIRTWPFSQNQALWKGNVINNQNDIQILTMLEKHPIFNFKK